MLKIFFSDSNLTLPNESKLIDSNQLKILEQNLKIKKLVLLHQIHSNTGKKIISINDINNQEYFKGDYLITNLRNVGLIIRTADCLPIIIFDEAKQVVANIHAGWRGSVAGIVENVIDDLKKNFNSDLSDLKIYFGPCAKVCCYKVSEEFKQNLGTLANQTTKYLNNELYFDLPKYNLLILEKLGINAKKIDLTNNICTICNHNYYSYRRDNKQLQRQVNFAALI